jgi:phosphoribosylaminoimidazole-succinocarboxamide synthase
VRQTALQLYAEAAAYALTRGIIIADTKFEFGLDEDGTLTLMDEILTPDSSRFWPLDTYQAGTNPPSYDKQFLRDWLESVLVEGAAWNKRAPAPELPEYIISKTREQYSTAISRLTTS